jgi:putative drug exporter of the RND superfamily
VAASPGGIVTQAGSRSPGHRADFVESGYRPLRRPPIPGHAPAAAYRLLICPGVTMFSRWGAFVYRHRRPVLVLALLVGLGSAAFAGRTAEALSAGGWLDPGSESERVASRLNETFGAGRGSIVALFRGPEGADASSPAFQAEIERSLAGLLAEPDVDEAIGYAQTGDGRFLSSDGRSAFVVVELEVSDEASVEHLDRYEAVIEEPGDGIELLLSGYGPLTRDTAEQSERDLLLAEVVSLPIAAVILILVFASLLAAGLPLLVAGLAIPTTLTLVWLVAQQVEMSIFVQNIATMLGLALAIDYSLFMVSRFREELRKGRIVGDAVAIMVGTSGKAVSFSGMAVAIGLAGLVVFDAPALRSIGIGGAITVFASLFFALTFLPALLGMLGTRVDALSLGSLVRRLRRAGGLSPRPEVQRESRWVRVANAVMAHPVLVLVPTLVLLLAAGIPFLRLEQGIPDAYTLPEGLESREAAVALQRDFEPGTVTPVVVLVDVPGDPASPENIRAVAEYAAALVGVEGIERVESPVTGIPNPVTGQPLTTEELVGLYGQPRDAWPPQLAAFWDAHVVGSTVRLDAISPLVPSSPEGTAVIPRVRAIDPPGALTAEVGGSAALGRDFLTAMSERIPVAVGIVLVAMGAILFLLFGSVVLPAKAILMTLLSIAASFGALVWIFQEGNLSDVLAFTSPGYTVAGNPIIMFCVLFGLSMDYEVLLLSRIQEAWRRTGDNRAAVAEGLVRTAAVITGAAAIMITVFSAFSLAEMITIKSIGVGMAIAVFLDATIIRVLVVPALMRLMGRWNWWAPGFMRAFSDRLGFSHVEDEATLISEEARRPATT